MPHRVSTDRSSFRGRRENGITEIGVTRAYAGEMPSGPRYDGAVYGEQVLTSESPQSERRDMSHGIEVSVVIPCLNEANSLAYCVDKAMKAFREAGLSGEVVVADNGSTDGSIQIAEERGARLIRVAERGYGAALRAGIAGARGPFIIMGDADDSYDFTDVPKFVEKLREGNDIVVGNRFAGESNRGPCLRAQILWQSRSHGDTQYSISCAHWRRLLRNAGILP